MSLLVGLFLVEGLLALLRSPSQMHEPVAYPPHQRFRVDYDEFQYWWETNDRGLRYPSVPLRKPAGTERVLVVGDSYVEGEGVGVEVRFTDRLQAAFDSDAGPVEFINAGLGGQGVLQYARLFHWLGTRYEPDGLLICINTNDIADMRPDDSVERLYGITRPPAAGFPRAVHGIWPRLGVRLERARIAWFEPPPLFTWDVFDLGSTVAEARRREIPEARIRAWHSRLPEDWVELAQQDRMSAHLLSWALFAPDYYTLTVDLDGDDADRRWNAMSALLDETIGEARERNIDVGVVFLPSLYLYDPSQYEPGSTYPFHFLGGGRTPRVGPRADGDPETALEMGGADGGFVSGSHPGISACLSRGLRVAFSPGRSLECGRARACRAGDRPLDPGGGHLSFSESLILRSGPIE